MGKLTAIEAKALTKPGRYTDGDGLHLHVRSTSRKTWVLRFMRQGKLRDMGLGAFPGVTLAKAREKAAAARVHISEETAYPREVIEQALSHAVAGAVEAAYARTDLLEKRRALMEDWGRCCNATSLGNAGVQRVL